MGFYTVLMVIHTIIVLFLIMMVLIQRTDSDGMGGLGGGGGNQFMTGRATANLMTRTTAILAAAFMISSLILAVYGSRMTGGSIMDTVDTTAAPVTDTLTKETAPEPKVETKADKHAKPAAKSGPSVPKPE